MWTNSTLEGGRAEHNCCVIKNLALVPSSWEGYSKDVEFPKSLVFLYYSRALWTTPVSSRLLWVRAGFSKKTNQVGALDKVISDDTLQGGEGLEIEQPHCQWINQSCLYKEPPINTLDTKAWQRFQVTNPDPTQQTGKLHAQDFLILCLVCLFIWFLSFMIEQS